MRSRVPHDSFVTDTPYGEVLGKRDALLTVWERPSRPQWSRNRPVSVIGAATVAPVVVTKGRFAVGTIHQIKVTLREVSPPVWRRVHVPSTASLAELHEVIQVAMGWEQHHLHLFSDGERQYGDNARDETKVTLAGLVPKAGGWLGYRYDFGDMWDHDVEVEKVHRAGAKATYPRCSVGGRCGDRGLPRGLFFDKWPSRKQWFPGR
ncbi:hypothetical protein FHR32_008327 [Streptosporangium album]|uniref:Plasmid pRiA4b Orf3-like domain-containing protein n=1 Tax=Streptosporangium album TaxID=47479 RepID=A0A7W7S4V3_9ACTN|nr:plasmid pRiA4b ORF-3 family protein [Streptosporangium album]MBB4943926.1 hypothetical protein [Streptosporangium album]